MRQFIGPLIIVIIYLLASIIWDRQLLVRLRKRGIAVNATNLVLSNGILSHYLAYKFAVNGKDYGRRQRITKATFEAFRENEVPVIATYIPAKPDTSRLLDYVTTLETRDLLLYIAFFSVVLLIALFSSP